MSVNISGSYLQGNRHSNVSDKFNPIQAASVGDAMTRNGLALVSLSTGRAKHADKVDFQRTLSRYRGPEIGRDGDKPMHLDVIYDSKHMGRGVDRILLGIYRMVCTNGLFVGSNFFKFDIRHNGATYENLDQGIAAALTMANKVAETIKRMQSIQLTPEQREQFARDAIALLVPKAAGQVKHRLLKTHRDADQGNDLWTTFNVVQENAVSGRNVVYQLSKADDKGIITVRNQVARPIKANTGKDADFNQGLFDIAAKLAA